MLFNVKIAHIPSLSKWRMFLYRFRLLWPNGFWEEDYLKLLYNSYVTTRLYSVGPPYPKGSWFVHTWIFTSWWCLHTSIRFSVWMIFRRRFSKVYFIYSYVKIWPYPLPPIVGPPSHQGPWIEQIWIYTIWRCFLGYLSLLVKCFSRRIILKDVLYIFQCQN